MNTIIGIFDEARDARRGMEMLRDSGLALEDLSLISRTSESGVDVSSATDVSAGEGAAVGAVWGGLVGLASLIIPGVGPFVAGGALAAALASAATGAVTGAVVGGVAAALIEFGGIPEEQAREYESLVYSGKTLVAARARAEDARHVRRMLTKAGAEEIRGAEAAVGAAPRSPVHVAMYDESGRRVDQDIEDTTPDATVAPRGTAGTPTIGASDPYATREIPPVSGTQADDPNRRQG